MIRRRRKCGYMSDDVKTPCARARARTHEHTHTYIHTHTHTHTHTLTPLRACPCQTFYILNPALSLKCPDKSEQGKSVLKRTDLTVQ